MRCKLCQWKVSFWARSLFTGICEECDRIQRQKPALDGPAVALLAKEQYARRAFKKGKASEVILKLLTDSGLEQATAATMVDGFVAAQNQEKMQRIYAAAARCLDNNEPPEKVAAALVARGLAPATATALVEYLQLLRGSFVRAFQLLNRGTPLGETRRLLVNMGLEPADAAQLVDQAQYIRSGGAAESYNEDLSVLQVVGICLMGTGFVLPSPISTVGALSRND
jgi:hypothetical protein